MIGRHSRPRARSLGLFVGLAVFAELLTAAPGNASPATLTWVTRSPMPTPRFHLGLAYDGGAIYAFGGDSATGFSGANERYDPSTDTWSERAPMPIALREPLAITGANGIIYVIGGGGSGYDSSTFVQAYDPATDTWSFKASYPVRTQGATGALGPDGKIYVFSGYPGCCGSYLNNAYSYDPASDTWTAIAPIPTAREEAGAALAADGLIYVAGGNGVGAPPEQAMEAYDPATNTWQTKAPIPQALADVSLVAAPDGNLYAFAGEPGVFEYTPATDSWTTLPPLPNSQTDAHAIVVGGNIYAIGGRDSATGAEVPTTVEGFLGSAPQVISFTGPGSGDYGGQATLSATGGGSGNPVVFTVDPSGTPGACAVSGTNGSAVTYTGPGTCVIDANQAAGNGYAAAAQVQQTINIAPAPLTITASSATVIYGASLPAVTPAYAGFVNGDTPASLTTPPSCSTTATSMSPPGTYPASCSGAADPDYAISYIPGTVTISPPPCPAGTTANFRWHYSANGSSGSWSGTRTGTCPGTLTIGPQAMEGDLKVSPGATLSVGYDLTIPGNHATTTLTAANPQVTFTVRCASGATPTQPTLTVTMPAATYTITSNAWYPSGDQSSPLVYQGTATIPDMCGGGQIRLNQGGTFTTTLN